MKQSIVLLMKGFDETKLVKHGLEFSANISHGWIRQRFFVV